MDLIMTNLAFFIAITMLNIVSSTIKSVLLIKANPFWAGLVSAINYTINAVATLAISRQSAMIVIITCFIGNLIGVTGTKFVMDRMEKEKLWVYNATIKTTEDTMLDLKYRLKHLYGINSIWTSVVENNLYNFEAFINTKNESKIIKEELRKLDAKYYIVEPK